VEEGTLNADDYTGPEDRRLARKTDEDLVAIVREAYARGSVKGVQAAFEQLQIRYQKRVFGKLKSKLPKGASLEDATQEAFLDLYEGIVGGKDIQVVGKWMSGVLRNHIADAYRGKAGTEHEALKESVPLDAVDPDAPAFELPSDGGFDAADTQFIVDELLDARSELHREIVELSVFEGRPAKDVAAQTGATDANVYQVSKRFRDELRARLQDTDPIPPTKDRT
jgi:RNA polymerase sigma factor (sigma-70 family)